MIKCIHVSKVEHRGDTRLRILFPFDNEASNHIKELNGSKWSRTWSSWLMPFEKKSIESLKKIFPEIVCEGNAVDLLEIVKEDQKDDDIFIWEKEDYIYLKVNAYDGLTKTFLSGLDLSRNYRSGGYWKIKYSDMTIRLLNDHFGKNLRKWPSLVEEINAYEKKQRRSNKITAIKAGKQLRVIFDRNQEVIDFIKTMPYRRWDPINGWWTYPYTEKTLWALEKFCSENNYDLMIDNIPISKQVSKRLSSQQDIGFRKCPKEMIEKLINQRYSENTVKQYCSMFEEFINYHRKKAIEDLGSNEIKEYIGYLVQDRKVSPSYQNLAVNAIKFYYEKVLGGPRRFIDIDRPRREKRLPEVLSRDEITAMILAINNMKHKFILILLYSTGMRRGELLQLKLNDIDRAEMRLWIRGGKGKKDRYVQLGKNTLKYLDEYIGLYNPQNYLIEGKSEQYSASSVAELIRSAAERAGIRKKVTPHMFRHSYATHMLEDGVDTRFIQELLGHESIKTTQIYSHITDKGIQNIINPFDKLDI